VQQESKRRKEVNIDKCQVGHFPTWEHLPLDAFNTLFQGDNLGHQGVDIPMMLIAAGLKQPNLLCLSFGPSDEIVDHIGQLINLDILSINMTIELVNNPFYTIRGIPDEIYMFFQMIDRMVLLMINVPQG
jgi:hypothetical protein